MAFFIKGAMSSALRAFRNFATTQQRSRTRQAGTGAIHFRTGRSDSTPVDRYQAQHFEPRGPNRWFRNPRNVQIVGLVGFWVLVMGMVYFEFLEDVPYTKQGHFILLSRDTERMLGEKHFEEIKAHYEGKILPPMHPESVRAISIAEDIIEALRRGLRYEQDTFEGSERGAHDTVMAPSGKKSKKLKETWSPEEDLDDRRVNQSRKSGREC